MVSSDTIEEESKIGAAPEEKIEIAYDVFFCFEAICEDKESKKFVKNNDSFHKKVGRILWMLTGQHNKNKSNKSLHFTRRTNPGEYKPIPQDNAPKGLCQFKLDKGNRVRVIEELEDNKLYVHLIKVGNFHKN